MAEATDATLVVNEIFLSLQGEGTRAGRPCTLVRLTGCDLRCRWCDSAYAYDEGEPMTLSAILARVAGLGCRLVELTGGEPLLQPAAPALLRALCDVGYEVLLETSGSQPIEGLDGRVVRIVDVKCPSSGMTERMVWRNLEQLRPADEVKFVLADRADFDFARMVIARYDLSARCAVLMGAVAGSLEPATLAGWILQERLDLRLQVQLHKILWPGASRGV